MMLETLEQIIRTCRGNPGRFAVMLAADLTPDEIEAVAAALLATASGLRGRASRRTKTIRWRVHAPAPRTVARFDRERLLALLRS